MVKDILRTRAKMLVALIVLTAVIFTQLLPTVTVGAASSDQEATAHLEQLYKDYVAFYGDQTTKEGLSRVYDDALSIEGDSFAAEKAAGYSVEMKATVLRPVDGSKDKDGLITPSRDGYAIITASVKKNGNEVGKIDLKEPIKAETVTLTYNKSSLDENGGSWSVGMEIYLNYYTGDADKLVIPEGVEEINYDRLKNWYEDTEARKNVKIIIFPSTMKKMFSESLSGFPNLQAVYMPDGCDVIGNELMAHCKSLRFVRLSETLETIGTGAFADTPALTSLYIPASVKKIGDGAFKNSALRDVVITSSAFAAEGSDTFKEMVTELQPGVSEDVKDAVAEDLKNDLGENSRRSFYIIGSEVSVTNTAKAPWYTYTSVASPRKYVEVYALSGSSLATEMTTKSNWKLVKDYYTVIDKMAADVINEYYGYYMKNGRYPTELDVESINAAMKEYKFTNKSSADELKKALDNLLADAGYTSEITDWNMIASVSGCRDESGVLFEGYKGYISATAKLTSALKNEEIKISGVIEPKIDEYTFASTAEAKEFTKANVDGKNGYKGITDGKNQYFFLSDDGKTLLAYSGDAEKIVIPEGVEYLDASWWLDTDLAAVRCIILPDSLKSLPDKFAVPFNSNIEVVIMGDNVTKAEGRNTFWRCFKLQHLRLSENLENLPENALFQTLLLTELHLPNNLKVIENGAMHLTALRNIVVPASVETIGPETFAWPLRNLNHLTPEARPQGNAVDPAIVAELQPIFWKKISTDGGIYIPRTMTILSKNAEYTGSMSYWNTHTSWCTVHVNYPAGSTTEALLNGGYAQAEIYSYSVIDMTEGEASVNLLSALDRVPITAETEKEDVVSFLRSVVLSTTVGETLDIADFDLVKPSADADGHISGKVTAGVKESDTPIEIEFNRPLKYKAPYTVKDDGSEWEEIVDKYANVFAPNITDFSKLEAETDTKTDTENLEPTLPDAPVFDTPVDNTENNGGETIESGNEETQEVVVQQIVKKRRKKKPQQTDSGVSPLMIAGILGGSAILLAAIITAVIIILKKRKRTA